MRKARVLIGIIGLDQHEVGASAVARLLRDAGLEVIYAGRFNLPYMIVNTALQEDVDLIGLSCHSWEYLHYVPELMTLLHERGVDVPVIIGGSVITPDDAEKVMGMGVSAAFGPGVCPGDIIETVRQLTS